MGNLDCGDSVCHGLCHSLKTTSVTGTSVFYPETGRERKPAENFVCSLVKPGADGFLQGGTAAGRCSQVLPSEMVLLREVQAGWSPAPAAVSTAPDTGHGVGAGHPAAPPPEKGACFKKSFCFKRNHRIVQFGRDL